MYFYFSKRLIYKFTNYITLKDKIDYEQKNKKSRIGIEKNQLFI